MKVSEAQTPRGVTATSKTGYARAVTDTPLGTTPKAADSTEVLGIPESELTPKVRDAIMALMTEVERLRKELDHTRRRFEELERDANADPLVPVMNRRAFVREMSRIISFASRYEMPASLVYFDINGFKDINDSLGHAAGDAALVHIGELLTQHVRESDVVGRLGGDEFGVVLANAASDVAQKKAKALSDLISQSPAKWNGQSLPLSAAYGVYSFQSGEDAAQAMAQADRDMFLRKRTMKGEL